jgi:hypothetical protein
MIPENNATGKSTKRIPLNASVFSSIIRCVLVEIYYTVNLITHLRTFKKMG